MYKRGIADDLRGRQFRQWPKNVKRLTSAVQIESCAHAHSHSHSRRQRDREALNTTRRSWGIVTTEIKRRS